MSRKKRSINTATPALASFGRGEPALKKQSRYGVEPWRPGEIPTRTGAFIAVIEPIENPVNSAYGEFFAIEPPKDRGNGWPTKAEQGK